jgi:lipopolysaccharide export system permease protein
MRLFLYIFRDYIKYVVTTMILCLFLFILFDFIHRTTNYFSVYKPSGGLIFRMYLYQVPMFAVQALPIAGLLASVMSMVMLSRTNEISAMRAIGMGPVRIALPLAVGGLLLSILAIVIGEVILPRAATRLHHIQDVQIERGNEHALASSARWQRKGQTIVHFDEYDYSSQTIQGLEMIDLSQSFRPEKMVAAKFAKFRPETGMWACSDLLLTHFNSGGGVDFSERRQGSSVRLDIDPKRLTLDRRKPEELSMIELSDAIKKGDASGADTLSFKVDYHVKIAYPFAAFVVSLIGINFAFKSERTTETAKSILLAFSIGISYWFVLNAVKALGKRGDIPPLVSGWFANVVILTIILYQGWYMRRRN